MSQPIAPLSAETARELFRARYRVHPLADALPPLSDEELESLAASIAEEGQQIPAIEDASGQILDGRHRITACLMVGEEPEVERRIVEGAAALNLVAALNATRRHLSAAARALAAGRAHACTPSLSQASIAASWGVSRRAVSYALQILSSGDAITIAAVEAGQLGLRPAAERLSRAALDAEALDAEALDGDALDAEALDEASSTLPAPPSDLLSRVSAHQSEGGALPPPASTASARANRRPLDAYYTPPALAEACVHTIADLLLLDREALEPSAGGGAFVDALLAVGVDVVACDVNEAAPGLQRPGLEASIVGDALDLPGPYAWIVGNPPYGSDAEDHVRAALEASEVGAAFLLRSDWVARRLLDPSLRPAVVYSIGPRPSFGALDEDGSISWPGGTDASEYVFAIWLHSYDGPTIYAPLIWRGPRASAPEPASDLIRRLDAPAAPPAAPPAPSASEGVSVEALSRLLQAALRGRSGGLLDLFVEAWESDQDGALAEELASALIRRAEGGE